MYVLSMLCHLATILGIADPWMIVSGSYFYWVWYTNTISHHWLPYWPVLKTLLIQVGLYTRTCWPSFRVFIWENNGLWRHFNSSHSAPNLYIINIFDINVDKLLNICVDLIVMCNCYCCVCVYASIGFQAIYFLYWLLSDRRRQQEYLKTYCSKGQIDI